MAISIARALESSTAPSEFTADPAPPPPVAPVHTEASATPGRQVETERTAKRRGVRVDWYMLGVFLLILTSVAVCIHRLVWAMQP